RHARPRCRRRGSRPSLPSSWGFASFLSLRDQLQLLADGFDLLLDAFLLLRNVDDVSQTSKVHGRTVRDPNEVGPVDLFRFLPDLGELGAEHAFARVPQLLDEDLTGFLEEGLSIAHGVRGGE